ncbi:phosphomevalonate kinase [Coemansia thaxteri]|uniref:Phosphomevalonate kinase n=1 Tax=Coemansia thaxteri TaxID=2663907 RepID=A0A9W8EHF4_9FUNG|nr:phosphomevalonate kinase [Coemansia thaxteri]KAJ2007234.1 phosphomevalonate kinase [Coemansia thaxteri]KAJ2473009.1 phosphomevalonate kinase [Coemansia sp. RSA 2322]KAJ2486418.1 phosphomevalonate kinase [Coemansia sp. RSA 2320]
MTSLTPEAAVTLASAPGKVLVAGGYLVLERAYSGLVVGTDACLYAAVQTQASDVLGSCAGSGNEVLISVVSPQFLSARWRYAYSTQRRSLSQLDSADGGTNSFVQVVLEATLDLAIECAPKKMHDLASSRLGLKIVLSADNDFYSQRETLAKLGVDLSSQALRDLPRMCHTGTTLRNVHKTGLGSSAAMVSSLVAAILVHLGIVGHGDLQLGQANDMDAVRSRSLIHNVAQYAHCLAQGKVGSGFDVSAAVYGSHVYRRFSPEVLEGAMSERSSLDDIRQATSPDNPGWNSEVAPVAIPPRLALRLADVDAGSNTPSMVKRVLQWHSANPEEAGMLWSKLDAANCRIRHTWDQLNAAFSADSTRYNAAVDWCSARKSSEWRNAPEVLHGPAHRLLVELVDATSSVRALQRQLGESAGVPIEPPKQTRLLDACMDVTGVCMAAVPGAGGYDAIFCMTLGPDADRAVEALWSAWKEMSVGPLLANQASSGVQTLDPVSYPEITSHL